MKKLERITSRSNQRIKHARDVMLAKDPKHIFIEGIRLAEEAIRSGLTVDEAFFVGDLQSDERKRELVESVSTRAGSVTEISTSVAAVLSDTKTPQGIFLVAERPQTSFSDVLIERAQIPVVVYLHEINNPSNLGAVIRTAEAAGASGVVVSNGSTDPFSPKALRGAMGSAFRLPIVTGANFDDVIAWTDGVGLITTGADIEGDTEYTNVDWSRPRLLVFGSEAHGLDNQIKESIKALITIPMANGVESLNLAVSCGIVLFEALRQNSR